jgi:Sigma-70, region 4
MADIHPPMSRLDDLPPDQRAALSLLLGQGKSYGELAGMLGIPEQALHDRAHAALAVLAPRQARQLTPERRREIGDYLLSQQHTVAERLATRTFLAESEPARAWAGELVGELAQLASTALPDIPTGAPAATLRAHEPDAPPPPPVAAGRAATPPSLPSSRLGGALLLAGLLIGVIVAVILITNGGSSHPKKSAASTAAAKSSGSGPKVEQRLALRSPNPGSTTVAVVEILAEGGKRAFYLAAENLPPSRGFYYLIWLYNSPTSSEALSRSPTVGSNEKLAGGALLPANAGNYREMIITRETSSHPTHPGPIAMRGAFSLSG